VHRQELTDNLLKQIEPFGATFHWGRKSRWCRKQADGRFFVATSKGTQLHHQDDVHRRRRGLVPAAHAEGRRSGEVRRVRSCSTASSPAEFAGKNLVIVGGGDSALDWALNFAAGRPAQGRERDPGAPPRRLPAAPASVAKMKELCDAYEMQFIIGQVTGFEEKDGRLTGVKVTGADGVTRVVPLDVLLVFFGLSPKLGPIAEWGLEIERKQIVVDTEKFSTSIPGIFAVGDINTYPARRS
jgi:thioredoxin reductase (NADPH)